MSNSKKITVKRLVIFLILAFFPFYIIVPVMWSYFGEPIFVSENPDAAVANYCVGVFGMMIPSIAHIITRLVTKEGFKNTYLGLNTKGKMGYFAASVIAPLAYSSLTVFLIWALYMNDISFGDTFNNVNMQSIGLFMLQLGYSVICFFPAFGEEWGWRGYMMPKLMELMPKPVAVIVGGVIWGLWHAPLTIAGHNFGIDYPGYPFVGILVMCLFCVLINCFLTLVTEKTRSIYPASFTHMIINNVNTGFFITLFGSEAAIQKAGELNSIELFPTICCFSALTAAVSFALFVRKDKSQIKSA